MFRRASHLFRSSRFDNVVIIMSTRILSSSQFRRFPLLSLCVFDVSSCGEQSPRACFVQSWIMRSAVVSWIQLYDQLIDENEVRAVVCWSVALSALSCLFTSNGFVTVHSFRVFPRYRYLRGLRLTPRCTYVPSCTLGQFTISLQLNRDIGLTLGVQRLT